MKNLWKFLKTEIANALKIDVNDIEEPLKYGDFAYPCFSLAKKGENPVEVAKKIAEEIDIKYLEAKNTGPYLNFYIRWEEFSKNLIGGMDENFGKPENLEIKRTMVEHTSANPNKALHIGHIRNSCLGDCLATLTTIYGNDDITAPYIAETGHQVSDLMVGFKILGLPFETDKKFDQYCGDDVYVKVNKVYSEKPELVEKKKEFTKLIEEGNNETSNFADDIVRRIMTEQIRTCWRLGIYFDVLNKETDIVRSELWNLTFDMLNANKLIYKPEEGEKKDCWILKLSDLPEFKGMKDADPIIKRSDGTVLYVGKDIAYALWKHGMLDADFLYKKFVEQDNGKMLWSTTTKDSEKEHPVFNKVDKSIAVIDVRQSYYQDSVIAALKLINKNTVDYVHYDYELVSLSSGTAKQVGVDSEGKDFVHMSGRKGFFINGDTVLQMLFERAYEETKKRNPDVEEEMLNEIAEKISVGALRYEMEKISPQKMIAFDVDESLKLEGNSAPYLQYTYTRAASLLRKSKIPENYDTGLLKNEREIKLLKMIALYPEIIEKSVIDLRPHYITNYLFDLSNAFNQFYETVPVLSSDAPVKNARIKLVESVKMVINSGLDVLGISTMERM